MSYSVTELRRPVRRRLKRVVQRSRDPDHARRALTILQLWETGASVSEVARRVCAVRSSVYRWWSLFEAYGEEGIAPQPRGRGEWKASEAVLEALEGLLASTPKAHGYLRSRWSTELLALELQRCTGTTVHATTVCRWMKRLGYGWRRARPTLCIRDPRKSRRMQAIAEALADEDPYTEVFWGDEADVDLNPRIGPAWTRRGEQQAIPTPGQNRKRYLAGALHAKTGHLVWVEHERKDSRLFIHLLWRIKRLYRRARRIVLIVDNYMIHKSHVTRRWLAANPKVELLFQPAYHPWVNRIERLWKQMHDCVTRNHRCPTMAALMGDVRRFLVACQPFPGTRHALASA